MLRTSNLYTSAAMHVTDQPMFLNAAVWVQTSLSAHKLLKVAKEAEIVAGRDLGGRRWGPRPLDIDIIFHEGTNIATETLTVPHPRWQDRAFVCRPVLDLCAPETTRLPWVRFCSYFLGVLHNKHECLHRTSPRSIFCVCCVVGPDLLQGARGNEAAARQPTTRAPAHLGPQTARLSHAGLTHTCHGHLEYHG